MREVRHFLDDPSKVPIHVYRRAGYNNKSTRVARRILPFCRGCVEDRESSWGVNSPYGKSLCGISSDFEGGAGEAAWPVTRGVLPAGHDGFTLAGWVLPCRLDHRPLAPPRPPHAILYILGLWAS